jgi:hypothetical protein
MEGCCNDMRMISSQTPQSGLGQIDIVDSVIGFATGLLSKDPDKVEYDRVRQQAWDSIAMMVGIVDEQYRPTGTLTRSILQQFIDADTALMQGFKTYTDKVIASGADSNWVMPRFHDYYDFMAKVKTMWQQELATLPADWTDYIPDVFGTNPDVVPDLPFPINTPVTEPSFGQRPSTQIAGFDTTTMLIVAAVVGGVYFMSRKRG